MANADRHHLTGRNRCNWVDVFTCSWSDGGRLNMNGFNKDSPLCLRLYLRSIKPEDWELALRLLATNEGHSFVDGIGITFPQEYEYSSSEEEESNPKGPIPEDEVEFFAGRLSKCRLKKADFLRVLNHCLSERTRKLLDPLDGEDQFMKYVLDERRKLDQSKATDADVGSQPTVTEGQGRTHKNISMTARHTDGQPQEIFGDMNDEEQGMLRSLAGAGSANKAEILKKIQQYAADNMEAWKNQKVCVGIMGDPGAGKSTFINSIRGLKPRAPGTAKVGLGHTSAVEYPHPDRPDNLIFVDFPGMLLKRGTGQARDFDIQQYLNEFGEKMDQCHVFLVFSSGHIQHNAVQIGMKAREKGKKVLFVRSQFDKDLADKQNDDPEYFDDKTEADLMEELRQDYIKVLKKVGWEGEVNPREVFIISGRLNYVLKGSWDIPKFRKAMIEGLDALQKMIVINTCRDFSKATIKERGDVYRGQVWRVSAAATSGTFIPFFGAAAIPSACAAAYYEYKEGFGLTDDALEELAKMTNKRPEDLKVFVSSKLVPGGRDEGEVSAAFATVAAATSGFTTGTIVDQVADLIFPVIGAIITAPLALGSTFKVLNSMISAQEKCASDLIDYAFSSAV
ncbi:interferon-inducible GTPase 5-like [Branchiostoma floridae x Branchiostoma japonicum]